MSTHLFDTSVASEFGLAEAILINHFQFWIAHNRANKTNHRQGRTWTYNSVKALQEIFPYMGVKQIRGTLNRLQDQGVLLVDNYNQNAYDRTLWYAFANEGRWLELGENRIAKRANDNCPKGQPIPNEFPKEIPVKEGESSPTPPSVVVEPTAAGDAREVVLRASEHEGIEWPWETETFWEAWVTWREFKRKQHKFVFKLKASEQAALNHLKELSGDSEAIAHAIIRQSLAHGWKGFHELKQSNDATHQQLFTERTPKQKLGTSAARLQALRDWGNHRTGESTDG